VQLKQLLAQRVVFIQQALLLVQQRLQPLTEFGLEDGGQLLEQPLHFGNPGPRVGQRLLSRVPFHDRTLPGSGYNAQALAGSMGAASLLTVGRERGAGMGPSCLTVR